jgi:hypothetical protein
MVALVVVVTFVVVLLGILVAGLLRSHADILRSLHELGVGVGDPVDTSEQSSARSAAPRLPTWSESSSTLGPAPTVAGVTPTGDARAIAVDNADGFTLLAFLSSGCATCAAFWDALQKPESLELPGWRSSPKDRIVSYRARCRGLRQEVSPLLCRPRRGSNTRFPVRPFSFLSTERLVPR